MVTGRLRVMNPNLLGLATSILLLAAGCDSNSSPDVDGGDDGRLGGDDGGSPVDSSVSGDVGLSSDLPADRFADAFTYSPDAPNPPDGAAADARDAANNNNADGNANNKAD